LPSVTDDRGIIGLGLTYVISLSGLFQYVVRQSAEIEDLVSYEVGLYFKKEKGNSNTQSIQVELHNQH